MTNHWSVYDESMMYPTNHPAIPYYLFQRTGTLPIQYKMLVRMDAPTDEKLLQRIQEMAEHEIEEAEGMWAGEFRALVEKGNITFDLVFVSELIDTRKDEKDAEIARLKVENASVKAAIMTALRTAHSPYAVSFEDVFNMLRAALGGEG